MRFRLLAFVVLLVSAAPECSAAAETGDLDGDGRLSIADVLHLLDELPPAEG
jgi:hypothetical protein